MIAFLLNKQYKSVYFALIYNKIKISENQKIIYRIDFNK